MSDSPSGALSAAGLTTSHSSMANYKIISTIGRGNFGVCHLCECIDQKSPVTFGKMFVIKQINMSQLSVSEKDGAVQEVKLLSELHHPFIVGYRESFLEGDILNIVMNYCLAEDHQLLTNRGFLFLEQIEPILHGTDTIEADQLKFAAYHPHTQQIQYLPATSLIINAPGASMVEFTSTPIGVDSPKLTSHSPDISLLVTADHDMYVARTKACDESTATLQRPQLDSFSKQKAGSLLPADVADADQSSSSTPPQLVHFLSHAPEGICVSHPDSLPSALASLSLSTPIQLSAFLQLYGFWLQQSSSTTPTHTDDTTLDHQRQHVCIEAKQENIDWISERLRELQYQDGIKYTRTPLDSTRTLIRLTNCFHIFTPPASALTPVPSSTPHTDRRIHEWCWSLSKAQVRCLIDGFRVASIAAAGDGATAIDTAISECESTAQLVTPSLQMREDLLRALVHAGCAARFERSSDAALWRIIYSSPAHTPADAHSTSTIPHSSTLLHPSLLLSPSSPAIAPSHSYKGRTWCVSVPPHGLVLTRRAVRDESTREVISASQTVIIGNCEGGDLTTLIKQQEGKPFTENEILDWFIQLCLALRYIHQRRIIHRDLKSQNVFLTKKKNIRLGDFGIARVLNGTNELAMSVVGTPYSMSPEGCVLYELCTLKHAFDAHNLLGLVWKIVSESYPPIPEHYSPELTDLVAKMLAKDPTARPSIDHILELPFIRARLHSQIRAKMNLKTKTGASGSAGGKTRSLSNAQPTSSTAPVNGSAAPSPASSRPTSDFARSSDAISSNPTSGPTGTIRASTRQQLDVATTSITPTASALERLAIATATSPNAAYGGTITTPMSGTRASSAVQSLRAPPVSSPTSSSSSMLSPSDRLAQKRRAEADARARELTEAVRAGRSAGGSASMRTPSGATGRPTSGITTSHSGPYQQAFTEYTPTNTEDGPPRQRSAGPVRDRPLDSAYARAGGESGGWSGRNPPLSPSVSGDDRPIKSSGSYRLGANALSPAAQQAARAGGSTAASPSHTRARGDSSDSDSYPTHGSLQRPTSVSSSSRVTRILDDDDGDDSYSSDDFETLSDEEEEIVHELERTYTNGHNGSAHAAGGSRQPGDRPLSSLQYSTQSPANRPSGTSHTARVVSSRSAIQPSMSPPSQSPLMSPAANSTMAPSMSSKHAAIKERCLRSMSEAEFDEVYTFIKTRSLEALQAKDGSRDLTKEELANKFGAKNQEIVFLVEQLVFLSGILDKGAGGGAAATKSATFAGSATKAATPTKAAGGSVKQISSPIKPTSAGSTTSSRAKK